MSQKLRPMSTRIKQLISEKLLIIWTKSLLGSTNLSTLSIINKLGMVLVMTSLDTLNFQLLEKNSLAWSMNNQLKEKKWILQFKILNSRTSCLDKPMLLKMKWTQVLILLNFKPHMILSLKILMQHKLERLNSKMLMEMLLPVMKLNTVNLSQELEILQLDKVI